MRLLAPCGVRVQLIRVEPAHLARRLEPDAFVSDCAPKTSDRLGIEATAFKRECVQVFRFADFDSANRVSHVLVDKSFRSGYSSNPSVAYSFSPFDAFQLFVRSEFDCITIETTSRIHGVDSNITIRNRRELMFRITLAALPASLTIVNIARDNLRCTNVYGSTTPRTSHFDQIWIQPGISLSCLNTIATSIILAGAQSAITGGLSTFATGNHRASFILNSVYLLLSYS
jgi:hypothetical protein